ncbi:hypothetical protein ABW636_19660 [Aquimarina sp. 2201CG1-2-11]|uniref:hypothetical protein n=1 Tax=Aquimarina discodermiae TaxID=3231043 RepID=UPI00346332DC
MDEKLMSKKKPTYPIGDMLDKYLKECNRKIKIPVFYDDLLRFAGSVVVYDNNDQDTLWVRVYYEEHERPEIESSLKKVYIILHSDGNFDAIEFLNIDAIDYCTFGNSKPFRIKIRNILNDNYTYIYVKKADASRIYGLELEHLFSPNRINFLVYKNTLIEEHIAGIPGDVFIKDFLPDLSDQAKAQIAKEFVKFNERCQMRLLGDMRSYNYVIIPIHDFDHVEYKIRPIDFDQQCFEGKLKVYQPQFFKENYKMVKVVTDRLQPSSIEQYKKEERSILAKRIMTTRSRYENLVACMCEDRITTQENLNELREHLYNFTLDLKFRRSQSMGEILKTAMEFVRRNYENINMKRLLDGD